MNILRWNRKSKKKINFRTIVLLIFSLIMTTFAWFAYSKVLEPTLNIHISSWDMEYKIDGQPKANPITIDMPLYPTMEEETVMVDIYNNGETLVDIDYQVKSLTIAGIEYEAIYDGQTPRSENYITIAPSLEETASTEVETIDPDTNEVTTTTITEPVYRGAITNDITKFPFTIEIEYSTQVEPVTVTDYDVKVPGEGYLKVTVNWLGDNNDLDSEWGYIVGEYLEANPDVTTAMSIELSIDAYQADPEGSDYEVKMPNTSTTRPYLPEGFKRVKGTTLQSGLVIEDTNGNQYVWVEVPKSTSVYKNVGIELTEFTEDTLDGEVVIAQGTYSKIENDLREYVSEYGTRVDKPVGYGVSGIGDDAYQTLKHKMLKSIYNYGGFYIGRYETGVKTGYRIPTSSSAPSGSAVIKSDVYPYNYVTVSQAHSLASAMVGAGSGYTSSLMFGLQWDLVMKYLETKAVEQVPTADKSAKLEEIQSELKTDSSSWGNYQNNSFTLLNTNAKYMTSTTSTQWLSTLPFYKNDDEKVFTTSGSTSENCKQNIFDLAGNLSEWTYNIVKVGSNNVGGNGGNFAQYGGPSELDESDLDDADIATANTYGSYNVMSAHKNVGFRVALISDADVDESWGSVDIPITSITLASTSAEISVGENLEITATTNAGAKYKVIWESSDPSIATVTPRGVNNTIGKVTAVSEGTVTITARNEDGTVSATCEITIKT